MAKAKSNFKRTECPVSRDEFLDNAKSIELTVDGQRVDLEPKEFSTGSFGWGFSGKVNLKVGKASVKSQASINIIVIGSKEA